MKKLFAFALLFVFPTAHAAYDYTGLIQMLYAGPGYGGRVFVQVASAPTGSVPCDTNATFDFAFDATTVDGKILYSAILAAHLAQRPVRLTSADSCNVFSGIPDLSTLAVK